MPKVEDAIKELLENKLEESYPGFGKNREDSPMAQGSSQTPSTEELPHGNKKPSEPGTENQQGKLAPGVGPKENEPMKQGSSEDASSEELDKEKPGVSASAKAKETNKKPTTKGAGAAPNFSTVADPTSVVNQPNSKGNVAQESVAAIFSESGVDLSEEFKTKAANMFEAVVSARVTEKVTEIQEALVTEAAAKVVEIKTELVEKLDNYLNYVANKWLEENQLEVDNGLRNDITENFIEGLRNLFAEHYIEVPEEKVDVLGEMETELEEAKTQLAAKVEEAVQLVAENNKLRRDAVMSQVCEGLAKTEAEKLRALTEDVTFEDEESFKMKLTVVKESYFGKATKPKVEKLDEEVIQEQEVQGVMGKYVAALSHQHRL